LFSVCQADVAQRFGRDVEIREMDFTSAVGKERRLCGASNIVLLTRHLRVRNNE
jgi:hypothetical protein